MFGIFEVFADTIVICTLTALVILVSGVPVNYGAAAGAELTISGFTATYGGWVSIFTAVAMCCFAFSTIIGWGLYGARCIEFLFSAKVIRPFMIAYSLVVAILGATVNLGLLWSIAETFNGLMSIPNLIGVFLLSGTAITLTKEYFAHRNDKNSLESFSSGCLLDLMLDVGLLFKPLQGINKNDRILNFFIDVMYCFYPSFFIHKPVWIRFLRLFPYIIYRFQRFQEGSEWTLNFILFTSLLYFIRRKQGHRIFYHKM